MTAEQLREELQRIVGTLELEQEPWRLLSIPQAEWFSAWLEKIAAKVRYEAIEAKIIRG